MKIEKIKYENTCELRNLVIKKNTGLVQHKKKFLGKYFFSPFYKIVKDGDFCNFCSRGYHTVLSKRPF